MTDIYDEGVKQRRELSIFLAGVAYCKHSEVTAALDLTMIPEDLSALIAAMSQGSGRNRSYVIKWFHGRGASIGDGKDAVDAAVEAIHSSALLQRSKVIARTLTFHKSETPTEYRRRLEEAVRELRDAGA